MRVKQVILSEDYIVANGNIEDNKVLMEDPFRNLGSITQIFKDDMSKARDWGQFHSPSNLAKSIVIESEELLECFQWSDDKL